MTSYDVNLSILFTELPLLERPEAARAAGFDAVEFWWPFDVAVPSDRDVDAFVGAVRLAGVRLVGLNFFAGDMPGGDRGLVSWPARAQEFRDNVDVTVGIGEQLGCRAFNALYGNRVADATPEEQDDLAVRQLALAAEAAGRVGGVALVVAVERYGDRIGHVQIADAPGRHEPGTGSLDLDRPLAALAAAGYQGYVGLEYVPSGASADSFGWLPVERRSSHRP
jgi:hydroxypyruvate isomerase